MKSICSKEQSIYPGVLCQSHSAEEKCHLIACLLESTSCGCSAKKDTSFHPFGYDTQLQYWTEDGVMTVAGRLLINSSTPGLMSKHTTCRGFWDKHTLFLRCNFFLFFFFFSKHLFRERKRKDRSIQCKHRRQGNYTIIQRVHLLLFSLCESVGSHYRQTETVNVVGQHSAVFFETEQVIIVKWRPRLF